MRNLFFLIILLSFSITAEATCTYSGSEVTVNMSLSSKILSDNTLPAGSVLAVRTVGGNVSNMKSFSNCGTADVYAVVASPGAIEALGVKGIQGGKFMKQEYQVLATRYQMQYQERITDPFQLLWE